MPPTELRPRPVAADRYDDGSARRAFDVFDDGPDSQVNVVWLRSGRITPWQRHELSHETFFVTGGRLVVGLWSGTGDVDVVELTEGGRQRLAVAPGWWHALASPDGATFVYRLSPRHDARAPDVETLDEASWPAWPGGAPC